MKQGVLQYESMEIHVASMLNGGEHKNMKKTTAKVNKTVEKRDKTKIENKRQVWTKRQGCTKGLDGSRYQLMDVLGVGEEGDPWKTPKRR